MEYCYIVAVSLLVLTYTECGPPKLDHAAYFSALSLCFLTCSATCNNIVLAITDDTEQVLQLISGSMS